MILKIILEEERIEICLLVNLIIQRFLNNEYPLNCVYTCLHMCTRMLARMCTYSYVRACVCMLVCVHVICACVHTSMHVFYTHTKYNMQIVK